MTDTGWVKLHRCFLEWEWFNDYKVFKLFFYLLLKANHKDKKWQGIEVKRGETITSVNHLSKELLMSEQSIRTCITKLKSTNEITIKTTNKNTLISIVNYNSYQSEENEINKQINKQVNKRTTNEQQTNNKRTTTTKECKECKEGEECKEESNMTLNKVSLSGIDENYEWVFETKTGRWALPKDELATLNKLYQSKDVDDELRSAKRWLVVNPQKRKTARGMMRFLDSWLKRSNDVDPFFRTEHKSEAEIRRLLGWELNEKTATIG